MPKFKYNKNNKITNYLVNKMLERRPDDSIYAVAKRAGIKESTLYNTFNAPNAWQQPVILLALCSDLGIPIEEAILGEAFKYDSKKELEHWKKLYYDTDNKLSVIIAEKKVLETKLKNIKKSL